MTIKPNITIREATIDDADLLAEMGMKTFFDTYADDLDHSELTKHISENFGPDKQAAELNSKEWYSLIAEIGEIPVGYASLRRSDPPTEIGHVKAIFLARIYVIQNHIGHGIGAKLMQSCLNLAQSLDYEALWLGVWECNKRALTFYRKWGFVPAGTMDYQFGDDIQTDLLLWRMIDQ